MPVFTYTTKISSILGLVSFPIASNIVLLSSIALNFSTVAFPKVICLEIFVPFVTALAWRYLPPLSLLLPHYSYVYYMPLYFASIIPRITFITVSPVTPLGTRQISLAHIPFCLFFWQIWISKWRSPGVIVVLLLYLYLWVSYGYSLCLFSRVCLCTSEFVGKFSS